MPLERTTYEAEASVNTITGNTKRKTYSSLHASGGGFVGDLGLGGKLQWNRIKASHTGEYILTIYSISRDTRMAKLLVNGEQVGDTITFRDNGDCTGTWDPEGMSWKMIPITLKEGNTNTVAIQSFDDLWAPNFDRITIHPVLSDDDITGIPSPTTETDKAIYALNGCKLSGLPQKGIFIKDGKKVLVK